MGPVQRWVPAVVCGCESPVCNVNGVPEVLQSAAAFFGRPCACWQSERGQRGCHRWGRHRGLLYGCCSESVLLLQECQSVLCQDQWGMEEDSRLLLWTDQMQR